MHDAIPMKPQRSPRIARTQATIAADRFVRSLVRRGPVRSFAGRHRSRHRCRDWHLWPQPSPTARRASSIARRSAASASAVRSRTRSGCGSDPISRSGKAGSSVTASATTKGCSRTSGPAPPGSSRSRSRGPCSARDAATATERGSHSSASTGRVHAVTATAALRQSATTPYMGCGRRPCSCSHSRRLGSRGWRT
jgi:hypothetical protein